MQRKAGHSQHQRYQGRNPEPPELFFEETDALLNGDRGGFGSTGKA